ncbi:MAG: zinc ribbon domain-containing protein [Actinobacteria bacterium]|nr:zinc ribbon domain-containing protein [Actinomycetota bacterium]MBU1944934.1 zinc ribbon domain-containing protein [Actinomycetota bacterium]MBU2688140.1 zinc ribbon domain-containing protein [Actinomycetota bacterium]
MYCEECGKEIKDGTKFCPFCGGTQEETPPGAGARAPEQTETVPAAAAEAPPPAVVTPAPATMTPPPAPAPAAPTPPGRSFNWKVLAVAAGAVVLVAVIVVVLVVALSGGDQKGETGKETGTAPGGTAASTLPASAIALDWKAQTSGTSEGLSGVSALDSSHVWAVGGGGTILFYDGSSWKKQESGTTDDLNDVFALNPTNVWAVGQGKTVLFFNGSSWAPVDIGIPARDPNGPPNQPDSLDAVFALDAHHLWVGGGIIINQDAKIYFFDGVGWKEQETPGAFVKGLWASSPSSAWAVGNLGTLLHFDGSSWSAATNTAVPEGKAAPYYNRVAGSGPNDLWVTAGYDIYHREGSTWEKTTVSKSSLVEGVAAADTDSVRAVGANGIIVSYDGKEWGSEDAGTRTRLTEVTCPDAQNAWAVGENGTILYGH